MIEVHLHCCIYYLSPTVFLPGFIDDSPHNDQAGPSTLPPPLPSNFDDAEQLAADIVRRYRRNPVRPPIEEDEDYDDDENPHWQPPRLTVGDINLDFLPSIDDPEMYRVLVGRGREYGFLTWLLKLAEDGYNTHVRTAFTRPGHSRYGFCGGDQREVPRLGFEKSTDTARSARSA